MACGAEQLSEGSGLVVEVWNSAVGMEDWGEVMTLPQRALLARGRVVMSHWYAYQVAGFGFVKVARA